MANYAHHHEADSDRNLDDEQLALAQEVGGTSPQAATQSLADIHQLYPGDATLDAEAKVCRAPDVEQLSLHGAAPEPAHVDPAVTAVAQAELETKPGGAAPHDAEPAAEDTGGPEIGTIQHGAHAEAPAEPAHDVPSAAVLSGAAQGLSTAVAETPAAPGAATAATAAKAVPATTATAEAAPSGAHEPPAHEKAPSWEDGARRYNQHHGLVAQFNAATHDACGSGGDVDPNAVASWQAAHGVHPDGRVGHETLAAASRPAAAKPAEHAEHATPTEHAAVTPAHVADAQPVEHAVGKPAVTTPDHAETKPAVHDPAVIAKPQPVTPAVTAKPQPVTPAVTAKPQPVTPAPAVTTTPKPATPTVATSGTADSFAGTEDTRGAEKDRWTSYGKGDNKTYGWDLGGSHGVKHSGGDTSAAIYAVSNVEGRYDSVQTYDAGILSFGIMQWTLHAGSLQKFLGFLKDRSGPEGRAAFQDDFAAKGIDVKPAGGQYQLWYNGKEYALGEDGAGKAAIDKLVREDKTTARTWSDVFHTAGADPRVQKAQFERAKEMFKETQGIKFGQKIVDQSLKACKNTFHAKYRDQYGKAEGWMSASPKAAALFFSMRVNNPMYANAAFLKAIDAFYDAHGTDSTKWPAHWGDSFGDLVAGKSAETLSNWGKEGGGEGRVDKTLRFWDKVHGQPGSAPTAAHTTPPPVAAVAAKKDDAKVDPALQKKLSEQHASLVNQVLHAVLEPAEAVRHIIAFDQKLNGGTSSMACLTMLPLLLADLWKALSGRPQQPQQPKPTPAPVIAKHDAPAPVTAKPVPVTAKPTPVTAKPAPDATHTPLPVTPVKAPVPAHPEPAPVTVAPPSSGMTSMVIEVDGQYCQIYVSPGGLTNDAPDVFMFFHGHDAQLGIDPRLKGQAGNASGEDTAGAAVAQAKAKNTIVILPQGVLGKGASHEKEGGFMAALKSGQSGAFAVFVDDILAQVGPKMGRANELKPRHISLAGHSAGGYQGIHDALHSAAKGKYADTISDITLMDSSYAPSHFSDTRDWLFTGSPGKTVRIVQSPDQLKHGYIKDKDKNVVVVEAWHKKYFDEAKLDAYAKANKMTVKPIGVAGDDRGASTRAVQHTQILTADGKVQGDVLILESSLDHHAIRDNVIDDSIDSIGQGADGADGYGRNHIDNYGRKDAPKKAKPDKHAPKADAHVPVPAPADAKHDAAVAQPDKAKPVAPDDHDAGHATGPLRAEAKPPVDAKPDAAHDHGEHGDHQAPANPDGKEKVTGGKPKAFIPVGREVYKEGGTLSHDHLGHGNKVTDLTNKDPKKRTIHLDEAQYKFKQTCYDFAVGRLGDHIYGGVAKDDLGPTENGKMYRKDCIPHLDAMLTAMRGDLSGGKSVLNDKGVEIKAPAKGGITVGSAYRSPTDDRDLWDSYFQRYFIETMDQREKLPGGPLSEEAAHWLVLNVIAWRKAPPGGSNHSNGNAVDLVRTVNGKWQDNDYDHQGGWRSSWEYFWLVANAKTYGFKNYPKEAWHWEWYK